MISRALNAPLVPNVAMSLMTFHKIFIATSVVFCFGFGFLQISHYVESKATETLLLGIGSIAASGSLVLYLQSLIRKRAPTSSWQSQGKSGRVDHRHH